MGLAKRFMVMLVLVPALGQVGAVLAQSGSGAAGVEYVRTLEERIETLEKIVQQLQGQLQATAAVSSPPLARSQPRADAPVSPPPIQAETGPDRAIKFSGYMFGDYYWVGGNHDPGLVDRNGFWFRRVYLGLDKPLSDNLDVRLRFEMNSSGILDSSKKLEPFVKDAYLRWKFSKRHHLYLGLSPAPVWNVVESFWGVRPVEKTLADLQKMGSSRDFGLALRGSLDSSNRVRYHFQVGNGASTGGETDKSKKTAFSLGLYPSKSTVLEFYTDYDNRPLDQDRYTFQGLAGFRTDRGRAGVQYVYQKRKGTTEIGLDGLSLFGALKVASQVSLFGRYDRMFDPNPDGGGIAYIPFDPDSKSNFFVAGMDIQVSERVHLMPNVEVVRYDEAGGTRPDTDWIPRLTFYYTY